MRILPKNYRRNKFKAVKTEVDGIKFHSKKEAEKYTELKLLEKAGKISKLEIQPKFDIVIGGISVCKYISDFRFQENGKTVVLDIKGFKTPVYRLKKKLMKIVLGIDVQEE